MDPINADCKTTYKAVHNSGTRKLSQIKWIVLHDEEATTAESAASWFTNEASEGSAHLCVDDNVCLRTLPNSAIPWGAASSFGANTGGFHIEQAGLAKWSAVIWKSHLNTLKRAAFKTAYHCHLFKVPVVWVPAAELLKGTKGITTHAEVSKASKIQDPAHAGNYSHTDPGPFWPRVLFMSLVKSYYKQLSK